MKDTIAKIINKNEKWISAKTVAKEPMAKIKN
jgi:hypothetical protein